MSSTRRLRLAAWLSAASLVGIVPHVIEDVTLGVPQRFGLSSVTAGWMFGLFVAAQVAAALAAVEGRHWGAPAVALIGAVWVILAIADHPGAFQPGSFRSGSASRLWVWSLVLLQAASAGLAASVIRRERP